MNNNYFYGVYLPHVPEVKQIKDDGHHDVHIELVDLGKSLNWDKVNKE